MQAADAYRPGGELLLNPVPLLANALGHRTLQIHYPHQLPSCCWPILRQLSLPCSANLASPHTSDSCVCLVLLLSPGWPLLWEPAVRRLPVLTTLATHLPAASLATASALVATPTWGPSAALASLRPASPSIYMRPCILSVYPRRRLLRRSTPTWPLAPYGTMLP